MLGYIYSLAGHTLNLGLRIASYRNTKAKEILLGRKKTPSILRSSLDPNRPKIWIHASSLGEFEQGRPLIEYIKAHYPDWQVILSFYSPSGYNVRHNYELADAVVYLMGDTPREVKTFLDASKPDIAVFVKYDFWPVMLGELQRRGVATYLVSAIFREQQLFFKPWGGLYRRVLKYFDHLFVQDEESKARLATIGIRCVSVTGDTRFDRVESIAQEAVSVPQLEVLKSRANPILVAGSTWGVDEEMLMQISDSLPQLSIVYAPHELSEERMQILESHYGTSICRLSHLRNGKREMEGLSHLIIDSFGLLSSLYRYADIAYVGGGFGKSIHNTIEAAVYGIPVVFGPKYEKFREAKLLIQSGGGYSVDTQQKLLDLLIRLVDNKSVRQQAGEASRALVCSQLGATEMIVKNLFI